MLNSNRLQDLNRSFTDVTILATKATTTKDVVRNARHQTDHIYNDVTFPAVTCNILTYHFLGSIVGFSQYTANFIYVYIYCMSRGRHVSASLILGHLQVHRSLCSLQCQV